MHLPGPDWYQTKNPYYVDSVVDTASMRDENVPVDRAIIGRQDPSEAIYMYDASNTDADDGENVIRIDGETVGAWVKIAGGTSSTSYIYRQLLAGSYDGVNRVFNLPVISLHVVPTAPVLVYHNGKTLRFDEYEVFESVLGGGFDRVRILYFAPNATHKLFADLIPA